MLKRIAIATIAVATLGGTASAAPEPVGDPEPTVVCVVNAGMPGDGVPDAAPRLDCSPVLSCVVIDGIDGDTPTARLVLCQGAEQ